MNKINIKTKWAIVGNKYSWDKALKEKTLFDSKEDAEKKNKERYVFGKVAEVAVLDGEYVPGECKAYPIAVTVIKYRDLNGKIWETSQGCEYANACIILNKVIGKDVFKVEEEHISWIDLKIKRCVVCFTLKEQSQIDALWTIFKWYYKDILKQKNLLDYRYYENGACDEWNKQLDRAKWIHKLNNIQKIFDAYGSVICKFDKHMEIGCCRGEEYEYDTVSLLVKLNKTGIKYINKNPNDKSCKTCKYRGTDCGYTCKDNNPRCYVKATNKDIGNRPGVYADSFDEKDVYDWNELFEYDFDVNKMQF